MQLIIVENSDQFCSKPIVLFLLVIFVVSVTAAMLVEFPKGYHNWKELARQLGVKEPEITVTGKENGVLCDVLFHWGQEMSGNLSGLWCIN